MSRRTSWLRWKSFTVGGIWTPYLSVTKQLRYHCATLPSCETGCTAAMSLIALVCSQPSGQSEISDSALKNSDCLVWISEKDFEDRNNWNDKSDYSEGRSLIDFSDSGDQIFTPGVSILWLEGRLLSGKSIQTGKSEKFGLNFQILLNSVMYRLKLI